MSEFQFYGFEALDRRLTRQEREELREMSTRAHITARSFSNTYSFGGPKFDPQLMIRRYFDTFLYFADFGPRWIMVRIPERPRSYETALRYLVPEQASSAWPAPATVDRHDGSLILSYTAETDTELFDIDEMQDDLADARQSLVDGDDRFLYLGWLLRDQRGTPPSSRVDLNVDDPIGCVAEFLGLSDFAKSDIEKFFPGDSRNR